MLSKFLFERHQDDGRAPPTNQPRHVKPQKRTTRKEGHMPNIGEDEDFQSNNGSFGNGQMPFQAQSSHLATGARSYPFMSPNTQNMNQNMRQTFSKAQKQTQSLVEKRVAPNMDRNGSNESDDSDSSSSHIGTEPMSTRMVGLSIHDPIPSPTSRDNSYPQIATQFSQAPLPSISRMKSDSQKSTTPQIDRRMGSSNSPNLTPGSHPNPSLPPDRKSVV